MNPWPYVTLSVLGAVGSVAAARPAVEELEKLVAMYERGEIPSRRQRLMASRWGFLGLAFSIVWLIGVVGVSAYLFSLT